MNREPDRLDKVATKKRAIVTSLVLVVVVGTVAGTVAYLGGPSEELTAIKQLQERLLDDSSGITEAERHRGWRQVKQTWDTFSESEQRELKMQHQLHEQQKADRFMRLETEVERVAFLDAELAIWNAKLNRMDVKRQTGSGNAKIAEQRKAASRSSVLTQEAIRTKERQYLDSTSPEVRAYHRALKARWFETHGKK